MRAIGSDIELFFGYIETFCLIDVSRAKEKLAVIFIYIQKLLARHSCACLYARQLVMMTSKLGLYVF